MLDHTKSQVEKIHYIDADRAGQKLDVKRQSFVGVVFLCLLCACLPNFTTLGWIDQQRFAKTKMGCFLCPQIWMP